MTITADSIVVNVEPLDIPFATFQRVQDERNSPATDYAGAGYDAALQYRVSAAFLLAVFGHESQYATDPNAIVVKYSTNNPGNCRSPRIGNPPIIATPRGSFVKYPTWAAGWQDLAWRLVDPDYVYVKEGRTTIRQIIERFAPASDNNVPTAYIAAVVRDMNTWIDEVPPMAAEIPGFQWIPETAGEFGYPQGTHGRNGQAIDRLVMHCTLGTDSLAWLTGAHGNSAHFLDNRDGTPRAQLLSVYDAAWAAGNRAYNLRGVQYEHECTEAEMRDPAYWSDALVDQIARNAADILHLCPDILPDREHVIGHAEVPNQDHTDPGPVFPWDRFMARLAVHAVGGGGGDMPMLSVGNPFGPVGFVAGFRDWATTIGNARNPLDIHAGALSVTGWPRENEWRGTDGNAYQRCERLTLKYTPGTSAPWDIVVLRCDDPLPERAT